MNAVGLGLGGWASSAMGCWRAATGLVGEVKKEEGRWLGEWYAAPGLRGFRLNLTAGLGARALLAALASWRCSAEC